eukprot:Phypoly_transcript_16926.p1 GENE.Phypoly_transcript_16926~~Phypoly_transcript_16926.p1  ORF type:complete len:277 (+),score=28.30 Phypoly_transcript_16926:63-833(+)
MDSMGRTTAHKPLTFRAKGLPIIFGVCVLSGFLFCLVVSYHYHFESVTKTHCRQPEFFPTISAAIGDMFPEKSAFRYVMALTSGPRILTLLIIAYLLHEDIVALGLANSAWNSVNTVAKWVDVARVFTAGIWIYVGSGEDHDIHDIGFVSYVVFTVLHQILHLSLFHKLKLRGRPHPHPEDRSSYNWKLFFAVGHMFWFLFSMYYFVQHRFFCAHFAFSKYGICEWFIALFNVMYDVVFYKDLRGVEFPLYKQKET